MDHTLVPILITWDVDPDRWTTLEIRRSALTKVVDLCDEFSIKSTFYFTANFAHEYLAQIQRLKLLGQEIGCHGLTHTDEEEYNRMPAEMQRVYIKEATRKLMDISSDKVRSFRSPRVKTSALTLQLLGEAGYQSDSSVCSQRMDILSSNLINRGWLTAPRLPYHPNNTNAFKRGNLPIWEIPVSAIVIPMISGSLNVFGLKFMKAFFRVQYYESKRTGKPIVFLSHPTDLLTIIRLQKHDSTNQFSLASIRTHGFRFRRVFFRMNGDILFQATRHLFAYMTSFSGVKFFTCSEYIDYLETSLVFHNPGN